MSQHIHKTDSLQGSSASERVVSVRRKRWLEMKFGGGGGVLSMFYFQRKVCTTIEQNLENVNNPPRCRDEKK